MRRKQSRPSELLQAALALFVERGFAATRLEDVARRAGVSKGTLYLYFNNKQALFKAAVREGLVPALERGERRLLEHRGSAAELLRSILHGWWEQISQSPYGGIPKLMICECRNFPELAAFYRDEVISRASRLIATVLERGMQSGEFRRLNAEYLPQLVATPLVMLAVWGHSFNLGSGNRFDPAAFIDSHIQLLLEGLNAPPEQGRRAVNEAKI